MQSLFGNRREIIAVQRRPETRKLCMDVHAHRPISVAVALSCVPVTRCHWSTICRPFRRNSYYISVTGGPFNSRRSSLLYISTSPIDIHVLHNYIAVKLLRSIYKQRFSTFLTALMMRCWFRKVTWYSKVPLLVGPLVRAWEMLR